MSEKSKLTYQVSYERYGEGMVIEKFPDLDALEEWLIDFKARCMAPLPTVCYYESGSLVILECRDVTTEVEPPADKLEEEIQRIIAHSDERRREQLEGRRARELEELGRLVQRYPDEARKLLEDK